MRLKRAEYWIPGGGNEDMQQRRPPVDLDQPAGVTDCHMVLYIPKLSVVF